MNEVKIQIPDNCELIKDGNTYIVKERKQGPPRSWEEFCEKNPHYYHEYYIDEDSNIVCQPFDFLRDPRIDKNWCSTKEEAEAFLALMQLRRLRNAWVENTKVEKPYYSIQCGNGIIIKAYSTMGNALTFPTETMAKDFADCFKDLIMKAKILL